MKIAHMILTSQNGGAEKVFIDYAKILGKADHENYAIVKNDAPYLDEIKNISIDCLETTNNLGYFDFIAVDNIKKFLIKNNIETVIAHAGRAIFLSYKAINKIKNRKIILVAVNHSNNIKRSLLADIIISVNREIFYKTIDAKRTPENSFILYNAIDLQNSLKPTKNIDFVGQNEIVIGVVGRFEVGKNFDKVIKMVDYFNKNFSKKIKLKIAGDGLESKNLKHLVKDLKLENEVEFLGWVKNIDNFFQQIDIFVMSSQSETFGLVILEAMKNHTPIIATNCDGPREILRPNIDCLMLDLKSQDPIENQISNAINKLTNDYELANNLVKNAFERLESRFSFKVLECNLQDLFKIK
ncbi:MAG: glycosyltransferase [Alphaproteobacteria bacterium]|nr:glycosyltransferase [Alphaproteobacteria bacterium]